MSHIIKGTPPKVVPPKMPTWFPSLTLVVNSPPCHMFLVGKKKLEKKTLCTYFFILVFETCLCEKQEKERECVCVCMWLWLIFHVLILSLKYPHQLWLVMPGAQNSIQDSKSSSKNPTIWTISCCHPGCTSSGSQNWKWSWVSNPSTLTWDTGTPNNALIVAPKTLPWCSHGHCSCQHQYHTL